jgi:N utilization substance protein A
MDVQQIKEAIKIIADEKGLTTEEIQDTLNTALAAAYRKDFGDKNQNIIFNFDLETGDMEVHDEKVVVNFDEEVLEQIRENGIDKKWVQGMIIGEDEEAETARKAQEEYRREQEEEEDDEKLRYNPKTDILLEEAQAIKKEYAVGDVVITPLEVHSDFGRMAAQTAKQVIIQKIREAEREKIFQEFEDKEGQLLNAFVSRRDARNVIIDLGKTTAIMPPDQQVRGENYRPGDRVKVYVVAVESGMRGPSIIVSRAHPQMIAKLFATEIPEIDQGDIEIKAIAREAGSRSKVAVYTEDDSIDPIGSCVGQRGARIQTIIAELNGEKVDIIEWEEDPVKYISQALSPAKVVSVEIMKQSTDGESGEATVTVPNDQLSLAIGKEGQNVRLAAKLTGWKINVVNEEGELVGKPTEKTVEAQEESKDELAGEVDEIIEEATSEVDETREDIEVKTDEEVATEATDDTPDDEKKAE